MVTYADYFNAQFNGPVSSGPVRLTIGRNEQGIDEPETWIEEELMDQIEDEQDSAPMSQPASASRREPAHATRPAHSNPTAGPLLPFATPNSMVWVLDTYVFS